MAVAPEDKDFVSQLDEASKRRAKEELLEKDDEDRELAVQSLRYWVLQQRWLKSPVDFAFLLRFLRSRKFSQLRAREVLENYWTIKTENPEWFRNVDPTEEILEDILRAGIYVVPKNRDKDGRRVLFERFSKIDLYKLKRKWGVTNVYRAIALVCDWLNRDENVQVNGFICVVDNTDVTWSQAMAVWNHDSEKKIVHYFQITNPYLQHCLPGRMKGLHIYNEPTFFAALMAIIGPFLKQKTRERMKLHGRSLSKLYSLLGMEVMPDEYLPDDYTGPSAGPVDKIVDDMIKDMQTPEFRSYIRDISSDEYGVDLVLREACFIQAASFRRVSLA